MHCGGMSSEQIRHIADWVIARDIVHFQMFAHGTHEAPMGQQPICPRVLWEPQQTPGCDCEKASEQSFSMQHELHPAEASARRLVTLAIGMGEYVAESSPSIAGFFTSLAEGAHVLESAPRSASDAITAREARSAMEANTRILC